MDSEFEVKLQAVVLLVEAFAYLALAVWCLNRREARWGLLAAAGAGLVGAVLGINALAIAQEVFLESSWLIEKIFFRAHISTVFAVGRLAGVLLLAAGFVASRRTPPPRTGSIYGS